MNTVYQHELFGQHWGKQNLFQILEKQDGTVFRELAGRKTFQFDLEGKSYFAKLHYGIGWREIIKNLLQFRLPVVSARNEWEAINRLQKLQIATMTAVAYGESGWNPATRQSYIVTEALLNTISLEDFCLNWRKQPPSLLLKRQLLCKLAQISRTLHANGICHRDYYLCHFLMHMQNGTPCADLRLSLIDLHRALIRPRLGRRWIVKDLAGLYYSAMHIGLTQRDILRFLREYEQHDLRKVLQGHQSFWSDVDKRAQAMFRKHGPAR